MNKKSDTISQLMSRRDLMTGVGLGMGAVAALAMSEAHAGGHSGQPVLTPEEQKAIEVANAKLVDNFVADYSKLDVDLLLSYVHDDVIYQITDGMPEVVGIDAYREHLTPMLSGMESIEWKTLRQFSIGQLVINERVDEFYPPVGGKMPRMRWWVSGYFLIIDNKIKVWRDFPYPGAKQLLEPAPKA